MIKNIQIHNQKPEECYPRTAVVLCMTKKNSLCLHRLQHCGVIVYFHVSGNKEPD